MMSATVLGGFFAQYGGTLATAHTRSALTRRAAMALSRKSTLARQEVGLTLMGVDVGTTPAASKTYGRVEAAEELGGARTIESQALISRNTAASDVTDMNADVFTHASYNTSPPANGNDNPLDSPGLP